MILQASAHQPAAAATRMLRRAAGTSIKGPGGWLVGYSVAWEDASKWDEYFSDEALDKLYEHNFEFLWENQKHSAQDVAKDLAPDPQDDEQMEKIIEMLESRDDEFGQEYEQAFNDAFWTTITPDKKDLANDDFDEPDWSPYSKFWEMLADNYGISEDAAIKEVLAKDTVTDEKGVTIDLGQRRSRVAQIFMSLTERVPTSTRDKSYGGNPTDAEHLEDVRMEGEGGEAYQKPTKSREITVPGGDELEMGDDLPDLAQAIADKVVEKHHDHLWSRYGGFDNIFDNQVWTNVRQFVKKWEPRMPELLGLGKRRRQKVAAMVRVAEDRSMHGHLFLGEEADELWFLDTGDMTVVSGDLISASDLRAKSLEYWESFFDDNPDEIRSMMDRGFMSDVRNDILDDLVKHDSEEMLQIEEMGTFYSPDLDESFDDEDEVKQALIGMVEHEGLTGRAAAKRQKELFAALEKRTIWRSETTGKNYDSIDDYERAARDIYEGEFMTYAGDLSRWSSKAAEEVVDTDGEGHGLDVKEMDDGDYLSVRSIQSAQSAASGSDANVPEQVIETLKKAMGGGVPETETRHEPMEGEQ